MGPQGQQVKCGKVGTGFKRKDLLEVEALLKSNGPFAVEVEFHSLSKQGRIRFPVFKSIRYDLDITDQDDVGISQFEGVPVST